MTAQYDFVKTPKPRKDGKSQQLHPRIVSRGTISTRRLLEDIHEGSSFTVGDLEGVITSLENKIAYYIREGYNVELGRIGYFSAKLTARPVTDKKEIRSPSVWFDNVNYRASMWFRKQTRGFVERAKWGFQHSSQTTIEECQRRMEKFLDTHPFITRSEYSGLTGRLKGQSLKDLNAFVEQKLLTTYGAGSHRVYMRAKTEE